MTVLDDADAMFFLSTTSSADSDDDDDDDVVDVVVQVGSRRLDDENDGSGRRGCNIEFPWNIRNVNSPSCSSHLVSSPQSHTSSPLSLRLGGEGGGLEGKGGGMHGIGIFKENERITKKMFDSILE
jgi:hypothetical protein